MDILIDFDGTSVAHLYPGIGEDIGAVPVLKKLVKNGHRLILFTMRSDRDGGLSDAIRWFTENKVQLFGVQKNPEQQKWTDSPKAYGHLIIDDTALGIPLIFNKDISDRPFVDWIKVEQMLIEKELI